MKCLGEDNDSSPRRDRRERQLPWASSSMIDEPFQGKGLVEVPGCAAVCSRGVSSSFSRDIRNRGIVAEKGQARRCEQSRRYRERVRQRREAEQSAAKEPCEGQRPAVSGKKSSCARPGCYDLFVRSPRSPHQRFCSCLCRKALRRVLQREARWAKRRKHGPGDRKRAPP